MQLEVKLNPRHLELEDVMGLDLETSGLKAWEDKIKLIILSTSKHLYILDPTKYDLEFLESLFSELTRCRVLIAHNAKFDCGFILSHYKILLRNWFCTQIASQLITNGKIEFQGKHTLPEVLQRYLSVRLEFSENKKLLQKSFTSQYSLDTFTERQLRYASDDVKYLIPLYTKLLSSLDGLGLQQIYKLENDLVPILAKMELEGCLIDNVGWKELVKTKWEPQLDEIEKRLDNSIGEVIPNLKQRRKASVEVLGLFGTSYVETISNSAVNYASSEQVISLFRQAGEQVPTTPDGKESVDEETLNRYLNEYPKSKLKNFIKILVEHRVMAKRISTYGEKFLAQLDANNKIHTSYTQTFTATGRLSSKAPNLQNIPSPEKGKPETDIRRFFIARPGYKFITCDMSSAEVAIAADYSQEQLLLDSLLQGIDMHSLLASVSFSIIFGEKVEVSKSEEPITIKGHQFIPDELRTRHKSVVFAKFYKAGAKRIYSTLAEYINLFHEGESRLEIASQISRALDKRMPKLSKYLTSLIEEAQTTGYLIGSKLGRIRYFDKEKVYGEAANLPIQNTNAEALKMSLVQLYELFISNPIWDARLVLNVHDEVVVEVKEEYAESVAQQVKTIVAGCLSFFLETIKGGASVQISQHWKK